MRASHVVHRAFIDCRSIEKAPQSATKWDARDVGKRASRTRYRQAGAISSCGWSVAPARRFACTSSMRASATLAQLSVLAQAAKARVDDGNARAEAKPADPHGGDGSRCAMPAGSPGARVRPVLSITTRCVRPSRLGCLEWKLLAPCGSAAEVHALFVPGMRSRNAGQARGRRLRPTRSTR